MLAPTPATTQTKPIRIVIADDHELVIEGFCSAIRKYPQILVAGQARDGEELVKVVEEVRPDVVLTDVQMPVKDGIIATKEITQRFPYVNVIALSSFSEDCIIADMLEAGAMGYLLKNDHISIMVKAIEKVMNREVYYSHEVSNKLVAMMKRTATNPMKPVDKPRFTDLELAVIIEICNELSSKEIAARLGVDVRSVESAKSRIMEKTGARNSAGIVMYAVKNYIVRF